MLIEFAIFTATLLGIVILMDAIHTAFTRYNRSIIRADTIRLKRKGLL